MQVRLALKTHKYVGRERIFVYDEMAGATIETHAWQYSPWKRDWFIL